MLFVGCFFLAGGRGFVESNPCGAVKHLRLHPCVSAVSWVAFDFLM